VVHSYPIMAFFDSSTHIILYQMVLQLRLLLSYVWTHIGISTKRKVPVTYIIRQTVSLHGEH